MLGGGQLPWNHSMRSTMHSESLTIFNCMTVPPTDKTLFLINFPITHSRTHNAVIKFSVVGF